MVPVLDLIERKRMKPSQPSQVLIVVFVAFC